MNSIKWTNTRAVDLDNITPADIDIEDMAHALSQINRFNGQTDYPISVAQHSVNVSLCVKPENALLGLLHDSAEYLIGDIISPVKRLVPEVKVREAEILQIILDKYVEKGATLNDDIAKVDLYMCWDEMFRGFRNFKIADLKDLIGEDFIDVLQWRAENDHLLVSAELTPYEAKQMFLSRFKDILLQTPVKADVGE